ncbi:MAG: hypothetical protein KGI49_01705 [Patescibacteria group bacterium]|nr:hypothetical protein [Patescibacteria group bacterium]
MAYEGSVFPLNDDNGSRSSPEGLRPADPVKNMDEVFRPLTAEGDTFTERFEIGPDGSLSPIGKEKSLLMKAGMVTNVAQLQELIGRFKEKYRDFLIEVGQDPDGKSLEFTVSRAPDDMDGLG